MSTPDPSPPSRDNLATGGFADGSRYAAARPDYPDAAVAHLVETLDIGPTTRVVDVGAGTGIFTAQVAPYCGEVIAVEPSEGMRRAFVAEHPDLDVRDGRDSDLPLPDQSVDVIIVAQAFHWFDPPVALAEFARVLRHDGRLGLIWNERDERVDWVAAMSRAMLWDQRQPYEVGRDFTSDVNAGPFEVIDRRTFSHVQRLDRAALDQRVLTTSYIALMNEDEQRALLDDVHRVLDDLPEVIDLPYVTTTYCARVRPSR